MRTDAPCPSWKRRDAGQLGAQGPCTYRRRAVSLPDIFSWEPNSSACQFLKFNLAARATSSPPWPSQGKNVALYLQIEVVFMKDFRAVPPAKSLAEHWAQCGWTGPHKLMGLSPGLSSLQESRPGAPALGKAGQGVGWTAAGRLRPAGEPAKLAQAPGIWPPPSHPKPEQLG